MDFKRLLTDGLCFGRRETKPLFWCCPLPALGHSSWKVKMLFGCLLAGRWGKLAPICTATLPNKNLNAAARLVITLEHTSSHVWTLRHPSRDQRRRRAHSGRTEAVLLPQRHPGRRKG